MLVVVELFGDKKGKCIYTFLTFIFAYFQKFEETGSVADIRPTGTAKLHTEEHKNFVNASMEETPDLSAAMLKGKIMDRFGLEVSENSVKVFRRKLGWVQTSTKYCHMIRDVNKEKRVLWCNEQLQRNEQFNDVFFTDESRIELSRVSRRSFRQKDKPARSSRIGKPKHPLALLVWGGISKRGATSLVIFSGIMDSKYYQEEILAKALIPAGEGLYPEGYRLFQDNDPKHVSKSTQEYMEQNNVNWFRSPAESPDLNPIENLWAEMKHFISAKAKPKNKAELEEALQAFWQTVTPEKCQRYINHIHKVIPRVIEHNGGPSGD